MDLTKTSKEDKISISPGLSLSTALSLGMPCTPKNKLTKNVRLVTTQSHKEQQAI